MSTNEINDYHQKKVAQLRQDFASFTYIISHDFQAPLRSISSLVQWIVEDSKDVLSGDSLEHLRLLGEQVKKMSKMIDSLLAVSRIQNRPLILKKVSLNSLFETLKIETLKMESGGKIPTLNIANDLPELLGDSELLVLLFKLIVKNAVLAIDRNYGSISVKYKLEKDFHVIEVCDNGPGLSASEQKKIFKMFYQNGDIVGDNNIYGDGLAFAKIITEHHYGDLSIQSTKGQGTSVRVRLPAIATVEAYYGDKYGDPNEQL